MARDYEAVRRSREGSPWYNELGRHFSVDFNMNTILEMHIDLEEYGRELGVLRSHERLEAQEG